MRSRMWCVLLLPTVALLLSAGVGVATSTPTEDAPKFEMEVRERICLAVLEVTEGPGKGGYRITSEPRQYQVLRDAPLGLLNYKAPAGTRISGLMCQRNTPIPTPLDYRVVLSGYSLAIGSSDPSTRPFLTVLTKQEGRYVMEIHQGTLTEEEQQVTDKMLDQFLTEEKLFMQARDEQP